MHSSYSLSIRRISSLDVTPVPVYVGTSGSHGILLLVDTTTTQYYWFRSLASVIQFVFARERGLDVAPKYT